MISERKRKWILGILLTILVVTPIALLNNYTLNRVQRNIKAAYDTQKVEPWMPVWQFRIAELYRYTFRDESAIAAFDQYVQLFYETDRDSGNEESVFRARDAIWDYAQVLEESVKRKEAYQYYLLILADWPDHPHKSQAEVREHDLRKQGYGQ